MAEACVNCKKTLNWLSLSSSVNTHSIFISECCGHKYIYRSEKFIPEKPKAKFQSFIKIINKATFACCGLYLAFNKR